MPTAGMTHTTTDFGKTCQVATKKAPPAIKLKGPFASGNEFNLGSRVASL
jgi:hypothetical protein